MLRNKKMKKAFTLVEMMIVIIIIGILMAALLPKLQGAQQRARDVARKANLSTINTALTMYFNDQGLYPTGACMMDKSVRSALVPSYLTSIPKDPQAGRITYGTKSGGCTGGIYAYSDLTKNGAARGGAVVVVNIEAFGKVANWVLSGTELSGGTEYISSSSNSGLDQKICQNGVFQTGSSKVQCSSSNTKGYVSNNKDMVYVQFN